MPSKWAARTLNELVIIGETVDEAKYDDIAAALDEARDETRPDYNLRCDDCGRAHILDTSIPAVTWKRIADPGAVLCTVCIDRRLAEKGLTAEAEFYFVGKALVSKLYDRDSILSRLRNPDEAMVRACYPGDILGEMNYQQRGRGAVICRALADVLATPPEATEE